MMATDSDKQQERERDEKVPDVASEDEMVEYDEGETKRILRKIDVRVIPPLMLMYIVSFIDRANIGNAKVAGMNEDLNLTGPQYNIALTAFFIPYLLLEVPCNIILKLTRPSIWMPSIMLAWGIVMTLTGLVNDFKGLLITRLFLGVAESGFFPGATYLLTIWYKRYEMQTKMVVFFAGATMSCAFSGLLAYAIQFMDGIAGLAGWKWIFIIEGLATVVIAVSLYFVMPDGPGSAKFLTPEERKFIITRLENETGTTGGQVTNDDKMSLALVIKGLKDWKVYLAILIYTGNTIGVYSFSFTVPTVVNELGYTAANAQLMTVPIYVFALIFTTAVAILSDRYQQRSPFILGCTAVTALGLIALLASPRPGYPGLTYGFLFLTTGGLYSFLVPCICWVGNNLAPSSKRAVGMAILISGGNLGGIIGSNIFLERESPKYYTGYSVCLGSVVFAFVSCWTLRIVRQRENARRDAISMEEIQAKYTNEELVAMGDESPLFRYTL